LGSIALSRACFEIEPRQFKYLNNIVEQDHRAVKRVMYMIRKMQMQMQLQMKQPKARSKLAAK